ncbi:MAG TPA: efflux RND transporter periplasmic adaptor subunit, partial [Candidatus Saccharimonadia bacterium]|nr:efflux RND transporter periplasmic adaptor subunit [Candidatus Saccharimonadia bacterium]
AEATQPIPQGEGSATTTPPVSPHPRPRRSRRVVWLVVVLLLGGIVGTAAWQRLDIQSVWQRLGMQPGEEQAAPSPVPPFTDVAILQEHQRQQLTIEPVREQPVTVERDMTGKVGFNEDRLTPVYTPYAGRVLEVLAHKGADVRPGQPLLVLESAELVTVQSDLAAARSDLAKAKIGLDAARVAAERARGLHAQGAIATKDGQQAEMELARAQDEQRRAQAMLAGVEHRLALFGKKPEEIARLGDQIDRHILIRAPIAGTIVERKVGPGQYLRADASDALFLIADLSTVWVLADVYESDLADMRLNAPVEVSVAAYPRLTLSARIAAIHPTVDPASRTVRVRCLVQNADGLLKPDMFATIKVRSLTPHTVAVVPVSAVLSQGTETVVFVEEEPGRFRQRQVQLGREIQGSVVVQNGVQPGERVVTRGVLLLSTRFKPQG